MSAPAPHPASGAEDSLSVFCASCHALRVGPGEFVPVAASVRAALEVRASHGLCPGCAQRLYGIGPNEYARLAAMAVPALRRQDRAA